MSNTIKISRGGGGVIVFECEDDKLIEILAVALQNDDNDEEEEEVAAPRKKYKKKKKKEKRSEDDEPEEDIDKPAKKRLMPEDIKEMKERIQAEDMPADIAKDFGVSVQTVYVMKRKMEEGVI